MGGSGTSTIGRVRLWKVSGPSGRAGDFWEERLVMPLDIYPDSKADRQGDYGTTASPTATSIFLELETTDGATGIAGPIDPDQAFIIDQQLRPLIEGADAMAHERLWDRLYRFLVHGRKGVEMMAVSAIDCAMWDLKGQMLGQPVTRLLGGPTRTRIPAYASMLGYSLEPERVAQRAREFVAQGYRAMKWFYADGPSDGRAGMARNEALVATVRDAVGPDVEIMTDAWMSWDVPYTLEMARRLVPYRPRWIEEPVLPDRIESYAAIRRQSPVPISGGEHEYTRWGLHQLMAAGAVDVLQPDIYWAGGITEMQKILALASTYDLPVIPHGHSTPASIQLIAAHPEPLTPILEFLVKWNEVNQHFMKHPIRPVDGFVEVPTRPGMSMELDEAKIEERSELRW